MEVSTGEERREVSTGGDEHRWEVRTGEERREVRTAGGEHRWR